MSWMLLHLQGMVQIGVDKFLSGTDLFRLQLQQSMSGGATGRGRWLPACLPLALHPPLH